MQDREWCLNWLFFVLSVLFVHLSTFLCVCVFWLYCDWGGYVGLSLVWIQVWRVRAIFRT